MIIPDQATETSLRIFLAISEITIEPVGNNAAISHKSGNILTNKRNYAAISAGKGVSMASDSGQLISTAEAAAMLNVSTRRIMGLCSSGAFHNAVKQGRKWMIPISLHHRHLPIAYLHIISKNSKMSTKFKNIK